MSSALSDSGPFGTSPEDVEPGFVVTADDGTRLWVEADGPVDAPLTLVFVHGFTLNLSNFAEQRAALQGTGLRRVFYDQRGFGNSERGRRTPASIRRLAADLATVLDHVDGPAILVGHSMGGMVVSALAGIRPDLFGGTVRGTLLIATTASGRDIGLLGLDPLVHRIGAPLLRGLQPLQPVIRLAGRAPFDLIAWLFHDARAARANRRAFVDMVHKTRFDVMGDYLQAMLAYDELASLARIGVAPAIVIAGKTDRITPLAANRLVAASIPGAELVVAPRSGHMVPFERADIVNAAIADLVALA